MNYGAFARIFGGRTHERLGALGSTVYVYHAVGSSPKRTPDRTMFVPATELERQLEHLRSIGRKFVGLASAAEAKRSTVALTFDDGYRSVVEEGLPVLERQNVKATLFVVAGEVGGFNRWDVAHGSDPLQLVDESLVRVWLKAGHSIGSHSFNHRNLGKLPRRDLAGQVARSKSLLEDMFGCAVEDFAYPHGRYSDEAREVVEEAGYRRGWSTDFGVVRPDCDRFVLPRIQPLSFAQVAGKAFRVGYRRIGLCS